MVMPVMMRCRHQQATRCVHVFNKRELHPKHEPSWKAGVHSGGDARILIPLENLIRVVTRQLESTLYIVGLPMSRKAPSSASSSSMGIGGGVGGTAGGTQGTMAGLAGHEDMITRLTRWCRCGSGRWCRGAATSTSQCETRACRCAARTRPRARTCRRVAPGAGAGRQAGRVV
jgi:hypothetical protein